MVMTYMRSVTIVFIKSTKTNTSPDLCLVDLSINILAVLFGNVRLKCVPR